MADDRVSLLRPDTAEWKLWSLVAEFSSHLDPTQWALIGGQMVALHLHLAGEVPGRTTIDVDVVADLIAAADSFRACRAAAAAMHLVAQPSITGRNLHRFAGAAGQIDLMVADHLPSAVTRGITRPAPGSIVGGQRALDRRVVVQIEREFGRGHIPLPDLVGAVGAEGASSHRRHERPRTPLDRPCPTGLDHQRPHRAHRSAAGQEGTASTPTHRSQPRPDPIAMARPRWRG